MERNAGLFFLQGGGVALLGEGLSHQVDVARAHGEDQVPGLAELFEAGGQLSQGGEVPGAGDVTLQVLGGDAHLICLTGGVDLGQEGQVRAA